MKKTLLTIALFVIFIFTAKTASAGVIVYGNGLTCEVQKELQAEETVNGHHVDFGVAYNQFSLFWIPVWNYGTTYYAFISSDGKTIYEVAEEDKEYLTQEYGIDFSSDPKISFWNRIGGKLIWIAILFLLFFGGKIGKKNKEEEDPDSETEEEGTTDSEELEEEDEEDIDETEEEE